MISGEEKRTRRGLLLIQEKRKPLKQAPESVAAAKLQLVSCCKPCRSTPFRRTTPCEMELRYEVPFRTGLAVEREEEEGVREST